MPHASVPSAALVNVAIAVAALVWYFRRQPNVEPRARVLRWVVVSAGIALFVYANISTTISRDAAATCALIGGLVALNFLFFPRLSAWTVRVVSSDKRRNLR